jgi:hypothetical protein
MEKKLVFKNIKLGFLSWLLPFALSFVFYKPSGELTVSYDLFKSLMIVLGSVTGCFLLFRYFKFVERDFIKQGVLVGISWFLINIILDTLILLPMMDESFSNYFISIGLRYTVIPAISITMGYLLNRQSGMAERNFKI